MGWIIVWGRVIALWNQKLDKVKVIQVEHIMHDTILIGRREKILEIPAENWREHLSRARQHSEKVNFDPPLAVVIHAPLPPTPKFNNSLSPTATIAGNAFDVSRLHQVHDAVLNYFSQLGASVAVSSWNI